MPQASRAFFCILILCACALAQGKKTILSSFQPPEGFTRVPVKEGSIAMTLRSLELSAQKELLAGDGKTVLCDEEKVAVTTVTPYDNQHDTGVDGIVRLWGEYLWKSKSPNTIAFPLDNGQVATWKDWKDGLRPKKSGGRILFVQITTPNGSYPNYQQFLGYVAEEMGALALRRESTIIFEDSVTVGDIIVALRKNNESSLGIIVDACKNPQTGEKLYLLGTCGTPSTSLYLPRPYAPVQGLHEWFTLDGARYCIGQGVKTDLRRVTLK